MSDRPYLMVSTDSHAGPSLRHQLRAYCPAEYLDQFDAYVKRVEQKTYSPTWGSEAEFARTVACRGQSDATERLADMDRDGVAAQVIFAGGQNGEELPFVGNGFDAGHSDIAQELRMVGDHIWNQWLVEFVSFARERLIGVMQIPIWDLDAAVRDIEWGRSVGLWVVNLPAPRWDFPPYNDPVYEPFWSACEANEVVLVTHSGGGDTLSGYDGPGGRALYLIEGKWLGQRHVGQLIFGGIFDRHPNLKLVLVEHRSDWIPHRLRDYDSIYSAEIAEQWVEAMRGAIHRRPSEYWNECCFVAASFPARYEIDQRHDLGMQNVMWADDYPHVEGTWPYTRLALRNAFAGIPEEDVRHIVGDLAVKVYGLDRASLQAIASRIGPKPTELSVKPKPSELPPDRGLAFRSFGSWA